MNSVFLVEHSYEEEGYCQETKTIGGYSSRDEAEAAIARLRLQPGFCDRPDDFNIDEYQINQDGWSEGYTTDDG